MINHKKFGGIFSLFSFGIGVLLVFMGLYVKSVNTLAAPSYNVGEIQGIQLKSIKIENAGISSDIVKSDIVDGRWQISETTANHLGSSALPGNWGNIVIYGHNSDRVFKNLDKVETGDTVILTDVLGYDYPYRIDQISVVGPKNIEVISPTYYEILTIYTCTGFLDSKRLIVRASPVR